MRPGTMSIGLQYGHSRPDKHSHVRLPRSLQALVKYRAEHFLHPSEKAMKSMKPDLCGL